MTRTQSASRARAREAPRLSQTQRAYYELRRRILDNELVPDRQYLEQELADVLQMSRTPVREALIRLSEERLVEVRPRHGARVIPVSAEDMREIYELLTELESLAARKLGERGLRPAQLARFQAAVDDMEQALERNDLIGWARADETFHSLLVDLCGNSRLKQIVATVRDQAHRARMQTLKLRPKPVDSNRDHAAVVEAIRKRDGERAAAIHRRHRQQAGAMLLSLLAKRGIEGL
jgi:DNA-binding GntR family transcriptional regulator